MTRVDSPVPLMHHDPDRSWITFRWQNFNYEGLILMFSVKKYALESNPC